MIYLDDKLDLANVMLSKLTLLETGELGIAKSNGTSKNPNDFKNNELILLFSINFKPYYTTLAVTVEPNLMPAEVLPVVMI